MEVSVNGTSHQDCICARFQDSLVLFKSPPPPTHSNDTGHDDWNDTLHHEVRPEDTHGRDTNLCVRAGGGGRRVNDEVMNRCQPKAGFSRGLTVSERCNAQVATYA